MDSSFFDGILDKLEHMANAILELQKQPTRTRHNYKATTAPTVNDDIGDGYSVGSFWADISSLPADIYICRDNTSGAAVWYQVTP